MSTDSNMNSLRATCAGLIGFVGVLATTFWPVMAQEVVVQEAAPAATPAAAPGQPATGPDGKPVPPGARPGRPGGPGQPGQPPMPGQPDAAKGGATPPTGGEAPKAVTRPDKPSLPPDPRELKVRPDPQGKIRFNFHGQPWADVLEWLAAV